MRATFDSHALLGLAVRWQGVAEANHVEQEKALRLAGDAIAEQGTDIIKRVTPKSPWEGPQPGLRLYETTESEVVPEGDTMRVVYRQTKQTRDGRFFVARLVIGGRGAVVTPPGGWPSGAKALWTPWGPRHSVGPVAPNPYPDEAMKELRPAAKEVLRVAGFGWARVTASALTGKAA